MTLSEIKDAVRAGNRVCWKHEGYEVSRHVFPDGDEQWDVVCLYNRSCIGLTWKDGTTMNGEESDFFVPTGAKQ